MYQELSFVLSGTVILLSMLLVGTWRVALWRLKVHLKAVQEAQEAAAAAKGAADQLAEEATRQKRRADEFFGIIEGVEQERDNWQRLYRTSAQGAGAAQTWLMRELMRVREIGNRYAARLRETGLKVAEIEVDGRLKAAVEEFSRDHGAPRPEVPGTDAKGKAVAVEQALAKKDGPR